MVAALPESAAADLSPLTSTAEVLAFVATAARSWGEDESDMCELTVRLCDMQPDDVRRDARVLRRLGYVAVANMMRRLAGRRRRDLAPLRGSPR